MIPPAPGRTPRLVGQKTRGKTAPNRLRKTDTFFGVAYPERVAEAAPFTEPGLEFRLANHFGYPVDRRPVLLRRAFLWLGPEWPKASHNG